MSKPNESQPINDIREAAIIKHFRKNIEKRVFILTEAFPFMYIGKIVNVVEDLVEILVQTTSIPALEGKTWIVHIHSIDVFYIETGVGAKIPDLKD
ncbi:hypothetical protein FITA111629_03260 [Filibacter tadaridae]|uniref:DUF2642 domain-containing protein n=1 Tax=Filibacter tadaridae TaxID=2483811 RepID=A0A3P5XFQ2_9BACL|nr:hypothetical protein [Filibacter tadaridae]VDC27446.1 hypothetical protein FILTAD_01570 [Filibacter tadaridae]